jgi:serine/threonine-protein kinase
MTLRMDLGAPPGSAEAAEASRPRGGASKHTARRCTSCEQVFSGEARFCPFDGDALVEAPDWNPAADPLLGRIIDGRYEVSAVIGEGGMGTVYEVRHVTLGRRFAMKVLRRDIADAEHSARFIQEAKAAAAIGHPNIVAVSDFGELTIPPDAAGPRVPYFVMEFLSGTSLAALLRAERVIPPARAADVLAQCARGLAAAHAAGVIHRDLKPDNVFLTRQGDREFVKLLDFGVAKMAGAGRLTRAGMVFGTPHYMSPEQAQGQSVDHRADIYALGVILHEVLTGHVPFEADTYMGVLEKHMFEPPESVEASVGSGVAIGKLGAIAKRCLAKEARDRFATMDALGSALEGALTDGPAHASGEPRSRAAEASRPSGAVAAPSDEVASGVPVKPLVPVRALAIAGVAVAIAAGVFGFRTLRVSGDGAPAAAALSAMAASTPSETSPGVAPTGVPVASASSPAPATASPPPATATNDPTPAGAAPTVARPAATARSVPARAPAVAAPAPKGTSKAPRSGGDVVDPWNK